MAKLLRPSVLIPAVLSVSLVAALLAFGDITKVVAVMTTFQHSYLVYILLLLGAYEAVQYIQWHVLLRAQGITVPQRDQLFAYLVGSATKVLPIGNFFENYLLLRTDGTDFGRSSAATLFSVLIEVAVSLAGLVILGVDHWDWLRPLIIVGLAVFIPVAWAVYRLYHGGRLPVWITRYRLVRAALSEAHEFRLGAAALVHPRVLGRAAALGAIYLLLSGTTLYVVVRGLDIGGISYGQVLAAFFFSLAFGLIFPLPVDIGVTEASGVGAFLAIGIAKSDAVSAMLIFRVVSFGVSLVVALLTALVLRDEVRLALRERSQPTEPALASKGARES